VEKASQKRVKLSSFRYFFVNGKIKSISSPILFVNRKTKKKGRRNFQRNQLSKSTHPISYPNISSSKKGAILVAPSVCTRKGKKEGLEREEKNMGKEKKPFFV